MAATEESQGSSHFSSLLSLPTASASSTKPSPRPSRHTAILDGQELEDGVCFYEVLVFDGDRQWAVKKRFQDFVALNKALAGAVHLPPFPPKSIFRNRLSAGFRNHRYKQLDDWIKALLAADPGLTRFGPLRVFCGFHADDAIATSSMVHVKNLEPSQDQSHDGNHVPSLLSEPAAQGEGEVEMSQETHELPLAQPSDWSEDTLRPWCQSKCGVDTEVSHMTVHDATGAEKVLPLTAPWLTSLADLTYPIAFRMVTVVKGSFWLGRCQIAHEGTAVMNGVDLEGSAIVEHLSAGSFVNVVEVIRREDLQRFRGRLETPEGWITLEFLPDGYRWAVPVEEDSVSDEDEDPLERDARRAISASAHMIDMLQFRRVPGHEAQMA